MACPRLTPFCPLHKRTIWKMNHFGWKQWNWLMIHNKPPENSARTCPTKPPAAECEMHWIINNCISVNKRKRRQVTTESSNYFTFHVHLLEIMTFKRCMNICISGISQAAELCCRRRELCKCCFFGKLRRNGEHRRTEKRVMTRITTAIWIMMTGLLKRERARRQCRGAFRYN